MMYNFSLTKKYYTINEVVEKLELPIATIRSIEKKNPKIQPKIIRGRRYYVDSDINQIFLYSTDSLANKDILLKKIEYKVSIEIEKINALITRFRRLDKTINL